MTPEDVATVLKQRYPWDDRLAKCDFFASEKGQPYCRKTIFQEDWPTYAIAIDHFEKLISVRHDDGGFQNLQRAVEELGYSDEVFPNGEHHFDAVYFAIHGMVRWNPDLGHQLAREWRDATHEEGYTAFADAMAYYAEAWGARGDNNMSPTLEEAHLFQSYLKKADEVLDEAPARFKALGPWQAFKFELAVQHPGLRKKASALFDQATTAWPSYMRLYEFGMTYALPDWGGNFDHVEKIARYAIRKNPENGLAIYASAYEKVFRRSYYKIEHSRANWDTLRAGIRQIEARDAVEPLFWANYAGMACAFKDRAEARHLFTLYEKALGKPDPNLARNACHLYANERVPGGNKSLR